MRISFASPGLDANFSDTSFRASKLEGCGAVNLGTRQAAFAAALLDPERCIPPGWGGPDGRPSARRFNVYRNNVVVGLTRVLREAFPATERLVGDEFFAAMCRVYVTGEPPGSPMLFDYGRGFPDFLQRFEPVAGLPYLRDVARIERAWVEAYHAPEADPIGAAAFASRSPADLPNLQVSLHPSLRILRSEYPALSIWQMNVNQAAMESVDLALGGEDVLIIRPIAEVELRALPPGSADFLQALCACRSVLDATESAMAANPRFDLSGNLRELISIGAFIGVSAAPRPASPNIAS